MKTKRFLSLLLCLCIVLTLAPNVVPAAELDPTTDPVLESGGEVTSGNEALGLLSVTKEQFTLATGETYWFDISGANIPGTPNTGNGSAAMPDTTMHYVPFTYVGTVNAFVLNKNSSGNTGASAVAASETVESGTYGYRYDHSLFISDNPPNRQPPPPWATARSPTERSTFPQSRLAQPETAYGAITMWEPAAPPTALAPQLPPTREPTQ